MKYLSLDEIIIKSADTAISLMDKKKGAFPPGTNGPHGHKDTPVRNTSHWLITILKAYEITQNNKYLDIANLIIKYLLSEEVRPGGYTFIHRDSKGIDKCNGLIGQAWTIEALAEAYRVLSNNACIELAQKVFLMHPFNPKIGLWKRLDINGSAWRGFDLTLNHQIWFAAAGSLIISQIKNHEINYQIKRFLDCLPKNIGLRKDGRFQMPVNWKYLIKNKYFTDAIRVTEIYKLLRVKGNIKKVKSGKEVEDGYHAFHLYGLGIIKETFPEHPIWSSKLIKRSVDYLFNENYYKSVMNSKYGIGYNPPGIEVAYALQAFEELVGKKFDINEIKRKWIYKQFEITYDLNINLMNKVKFDPDTYAARIYEVTRINNLDTIYF